MDQTQGRKFAIVDADLNRAALYRAALYRAALYRADLYRTVQPHCSTALFNRAALNRECGVSV
ncbi:MAG: hypothetical protein R3C53_26340 [Pirellulaceae bacterium]